MTGRGHNNLTTQRSSRDRKSGTKRGLEKEGSLNILQVRSSVGQCYLLRPRNNKLLRSGTGVRVDRQTHLDATPALPLSVRKRGEGRSREANEGRIWGANAKCSPSRESLYARSSSSPRSKNSSDSVPAKTYHSPNIHVRISHSPRGNNSLDSVPAKTNNSPHLYARNSTSSSVTSQTLLRSFLQDPPLLLPFRPFSAGPF